MATWHPSSHPLASSGLRGTILEFYLHICFSLIVTTEILAGWTGRERAMLVIWYASQPLANTTIAELVERKISNDRYRWPVISCGIVSLWERTFCSFPKAAWLKSSRASFHSTGTSMTTESWRQGSKFLQEGAPMLWQDRCYAVQEEVQAGIVCTTRMVRMQQPGMWIRWNWVLEYKFLLSHIWQAELQHIKFMIQAVYAVFPIYPTYFGRGEGSKVTPLPWLKILGVQPE